MYRKQYGYGRKSANKYQNKKVNVDGMTFDSVKEARRYRELSALEKAGEITDLRMQVKYILIPSQHEPDTIGKRGGVKRGKLLEREVAYYADFTYYEKGNDKITVEDTKGIRTTEYIIKRKLMLYIHGIKIKEI